MQGIRLPWAIVSGLAAFFITAPAYAILSVPYGWYLEANAGSTHLSDKNYPGSASTSGIGGNANIGYKFMPYVAVEAGYSQYHNTTVKNNVGVTAGTDKRYSYDLVVRGILPISSSGFELFAKLGAGRISTHLTTNNALAAQGMGLSNNSHTAVGYYGGAGAQYYFMPELAAVVQWQRIKGNSRTGTVDLFTGGVSFIFD